MENIKPWVKYDKISNNYGKFVFEPLERGMGETIGNALRRVLLSALGGFSITSLWVENVKHEFTTIDNVQEDVIEVIANLKGVILRKEGKDSEEVSCEFNGKKTITAKDLFKGTSFQVINPDHHIMTCQDGAKLKFNINVEYGIGYQPSEVSYKKDKPLETIFIDANFSPVQRINHTVTKTRVGKSLDYDSLLLEVWVNGSSTPDESVQYAAEILKQRIESFKEFNNNPADEIKLEEDKKKKESFLDIDIDDLDFSARTANALKRAKIVKLKQLIETKWSDLEEIKNFGIKCKEEVKDKIKQFGVTIQP
ncbi:MAG: DNA-directed RNA polymerase subunit alpha [bacterium]